MYEPGDSEALVVYIGSAEKTKRRIKDHVNEQENDCIKKSAKKYRTEYTQSYKCREKELYDEHVKLFGKAPACNKIVPTG